MDCAECGDKPTPKLTPRVLEIINNKGDTTIFHVVPYPASLGAPTDEEVKALQYSNVLLDVKANNDKWLFSSDGVAVLLTRGDWQLLQDRVDLFDEQTREAVEKSNEALHLAEETSEFAHAESTALREITGNLQRNLEQEVSDRTTALNDLREQVEGDLTTEVNELRGDLDEELALRTAADNGLQSQIDALADRSDVVDVVGTKAELDSYDTSKLGDNDIVKVLGDESQDNAITYYRWNKTDSTWEYVGETGPYYTKAEVDEKIAENTPDVPERTKNLPQYIVDGGGLSTASANSTSMTLQYPRIDLDTGAKTTQMGWVISAANPTIGTAGLMTAEDKRTLDALAAGGGGSDVQVLNEYTAETEPTNVYSAGYLNGRLNGSGISIGTNASASSVNSVALLGKASTSSIAIGAGANATGVISVAIGGDNSVKNTESVGLGHFSSTTRSYEVSIGSGETGKSGATRYLANVRAGELDTDAVNKKQMEDYVAEHGGGGSATLAEEYGGSSDVALSQKFLSGKLNSENVPLGQGATASNTSVAIGKNAKADQSNVLAIGPYSENAKSAYNAVAVGAYASVKNSGSVALGHASDTGRANEVSIGKGSDPSHVYYTRYLANVKDGELPQDAVTVNQLNNAVGNIEAALAKLNDGEGV